MKKLLILFALCLITLSGVAQSKWGGFFNPIPKDFTTLSKGDKNFQWAMRPKASFNAIRLAYDKDVKKMVASSFKTGAVGVSASHIIDVNGEPYNNFSIDGMVLFNYIEEEGQEPFGVGAAVTVSAFQLLSVGGGYDFTHKQPLILMNIIFDIPNLSKVFAP